MRTSTKMRSMLAWICLVSLAVAGCSTRAQLDSSTSQHVLFVGDSFTYAHGGIYSHLEKLAASATPPLTVTTDKAVAGGAFLKVLWEMKDPVRAIDSGRFGTVVLQDDIPETNVDYFRQYATMFVAEVRKNNARP